MDDKHGTANHIYTDALPTIKIINFGGDLNYLAATTNELATQPQPQRIIFSQTSELSPNFIYFSHTKNIYVSRDIGSEVHILVGCNEGHLSS